MGVTLLTFQEEEPSQLRSCSFGSYNLASLQRENLLMNVQAGKLSDLDLIHTSSYWKKGSLN